jgi:hypothetical protein
MIKAVFELPPSESESILVNLESLNGIWVYFFSVKACIQLPNTDNEKFIFLASSNLVYVTYDFLTHSEPAKSTK